MSEPKTSPDPPRDASSTLEADVETEAGFDRTLIREFLRLTPEERLAWHDAMVRLVLELRDGRAG
jgi:hypothetical protein